MKPFVKDMIRWAVLTEPANSWPTFDLSNLKRHDYVTASEAYNCARRLAFQKIGEKATKQIDDYWEKQTEEEINDKLSRMDDDDVRGIWARGHHVETWVTDKLIQALSEDQDLICYGDGQLSFHLRDLKVSGTPDGLILNLRNRTVTGLEIKSSINRVTAPRISHSLQLSVNLGIVQELIDRKQLDSISGYNLNEFKVIGGVILYIDPSNYLTMDEFVVPYDLQGLTAAVSKASMIFDEHGQLVNPVDLPPEGIEQWGQCHFCQFKAECSWIEEQAKHEERAAKLNKMIADASDRVAPAMPLFALDAKAEKEDVLRVIADYDSFNKAEKDAKAHKDALREAIVSWVKGQPNTKVAFEDKGRLFKVSLSCSERTGSLDAGKLAKFLARHDETLEKFRKGPSKVETLLVSVKVA